MNPDYIEQFASSIDKVYERDVDGMLTGRYREVFYPDPRPYLRGCSEDIHDWCKRWQEFYRSPEAKKYVQKVLHPEKIIWRVKDAAD